MLRIRIILILFLLGFYYNLVAQKRNTFSLIGQTISQIPDSMVSSTSRIANFINSSYENQTDKAAAIYHWITNNIEYDINNMYSIDHDKDSTRLINEVLVSRRGNCMHFCELFKEITFKVGIKSYIIHGYTKGDKTIEQTPHSWCAGLIDSTWYFFDPTWGAGYVQNGKFYKRKDKSYFMIKPTRLIKTHMPFDPLWQLLNYPITNQEFYEGKILSEESKPFFNYIDSLNYFEHQSKIERTESYLKRAKQNGIRNYMIYNEIEYLSNSLLVAKFNKSVNLYNEGLNYLNQSINIWNQFTPEKNVAKMTKLLDSAEYLLNYSNVQLKEIQKMNIQGIITISIIQLNKSIDIAILSLLDQRASIRRYRNSRK
jgi:hypothetical protein